MKKKLLTIVVVVSMIFCMLPFGLVLSAADAETANESATGYCGPVDASTGTWSSSVTWAYANGILYINGTGPMGDFVRDQTPWEAFRPRISTITVAEGVTSVGANAFADTAALASDETLITLNVSLPSTLDTIGDDAFAGCVSLLQIGLPDSLLTIGNGAFQNSGLLQIGMPDHVSMLGTHVFDGCTSLAAVHLSTGLAVIPDYTFAGCTSLTAVEIPEMVCAITESAFERSGITAIEIPAMTRSVGKTAFIGCSALTDIGTVSMDPIFDPSDFDIGSTVRIHAPEGSAVNQTVVDLNAQGYVLSYTTEPMPEIVYPTVQPVTFTPVMLSEGEAYATAGTADASYLQMNTMDLYNTAASDADLSASMVTDTTGTDAAADGMADLATADAAADDTVDLSAAAASADGTTADTATTYVDANGETVIDNSAEAIGSRRMGVRRAASANVAATATVSSSGSLSTGVTWDLTSGILTISGNGAMDDYTAETEQPWYSFANQITGIIVSEGVTSIGNYAFQKLTKASSASLPSTLTSIGDSAFEGCTALTAVTVPEKVASVGKNAFDGCTAMTDIYVYSAKATFGEKSLPAGITIHAYPTSGAYTYFQTNWKDNSLTFSQLTGQQPMMDATLSPATLTLGVGGAGTVTVVPTPAEATNISTVQWSVADSTVAELAPVSSSASKTATVLAVANGATAVYANVTDSAGNTYHLMCDVTVSGTSVNMTGIASAVSSASVAVGTTTGLSINVLPAGATDFAGATWTSADPTVATVAVNASDQTKASLTGVKAGSTNITVSARSAMGSVYTLSIPVKVIVPMTGIKLNQTKATMVQDTTLSLKASVVPDGAYGLKSIEWKSSDEKVATVSSDGAVKAVAGSGSAIITATATSDSNQTYTATCNVTVTDGIAGATAVLNKAVVTLGNQNAVVSGDTSSSGYLLSAVHAIDVMAKKTTGVTIASGKGMIEAISEAQNNSRTLDPVIKYVAKNVPANSSKVTLQVLPRFNIEVTAADSGSAIYMITPTYDVTVQVGNAVPVTVSTGNPMVITDTVTMTLPISDRLAKGHKALYITHKSSYGDMYYKGTVKGGILTFENPDGFSEFDVTIAAPNGYTGSTDDDNGTTNPLATVIYRLYNKLNGDHIFTVNKTEQKFLQLLGWKSEGTPFKAASKAGGVADLPIYRVYNKKTGEHLLTAKVAERDMLLKAGWKDEGIAWYAASKGTHPVHRLYNKRGFHHYTANDFERGILVGLGWKDEGIVFYQTE